MTNEVMEIKKEPQTSLERSEDQILAMIERVATNPNSDIEKMERLMEMRRQEMERIKKEEFALDYVKMKPNLPLVIKDAKNAQTKSNYAKLEGVNKIVDPILSEYGFATATKITSQTPTDVTVQAILWHKNGHQETTEVTIPLDDKGSAGTINKTLPHATSSSITYGKRIAICALLNISTGDDIDGNKVSGDVATDAQRTAIANLYNKLTESQKDSFNKLTGGILNIKKSEVDKIIAKLNNSLQEKNNANI